MPASKTQSVESPVAAYLGELRSLGFGTVRGHYVCYRVPNPGRVLSSGLQERLIEMLIREASTVHNLDMRPYWSSRSDYFEKLTEWCLVARKDEIVGWLGYTRWPGPHGTVVMYIDSIATLPKYRRQLIAGLLCLEAWLATARLARRPAPIAFRAQSAVVLRVMQRFCRTGTYPSPRWNSDSDFREKVVGVARIAADRLNPDQQFDAETLVIAGAYGFSGSLYREPPVSGDPFLDRYCVEHLSLERGDGLIGGAITGWRDVVISLAACAMIRARLALRLPG